MKKIFMSAVTALALSFVVVGGNSLAQSSDLSQTELDTLCSAYASSDYLVTEGQILLSHDAGGALYSRTLSTPIPAGSYDIEALSYEERPDEIPNQAYEQWKVQLFSGDTMVFETIPTTDIPEDAETTVTSFGSDIDLPEITRIDYIHWAFDQGLDDPASPLYHSVYPPCISFNEVPVVIVDPGPAATCMVMIEVDADNQLKATATVTLKDGDAAVASYDYNWGDGTVVTGVADDSAMHVYGESGTYTIVANVTGQANDVTCDNEVTVEQEEGAVLGVTTEEPSVTPEEPTTEEEPQVLGTSDEPAVLAETGVFSSAMIVLVGTGVAIVALAISQEHVIKRDTI